MHRETITPKMSEIASAIRGRLDQSYYLAGGTALALHAGHRESVDLDYFTPLHIDTQRLKTVLSELFSQILFTYEEVDTLWCVIDGVKVSFISRPAPLLDAPREEDGFFLAGLRDLVVMKLNALCGRDEYKDYYDLSVLATLTDVREWPMFWKQVYPASDSLAWVIALSHVGKVAEIPLRGKALRSKQQVADALIAVVKELSSFT